MATVQKRRWKNTNAVSKISDEVDSTSLFENVEGVGDSSRTDGNCSCLVGAPADLLSGDRARFANTFDVVKWNYSFHDKKFNTDVYKQFSEELSALGLKAVVKASRLATHDYCLRECSEWWPKMRAAYTELLVAKRLGCVLWQCPPSLHCTKKSLQDLSLLCQELIQDPTIRHVFEFRHKSWYESLEMLSILERCKCCLAWLNLHDDAAKSFVDASGWSLCHQTTDFLFLQCHGSAGRAIGQYSDEFLRRSSEKLVGGINHFVIFCQVDVPLHAWSNALFFKELIRPEPTSTTRRLWKSKKELTNVTQGVGSHKSSAEFQVASRVSGRVTKLSARVAILDIQGTMGILGQGHLRGSASKKMQIGDVVNDLQVEAVEGDRLWLSLSPCADQILTLPFSDDVRSNGGDSLAELLDEINQISSCENVSGPQLAVGELRYTGGSIYNQSSTAHNSSNMPASVVVSAVIECIDDTGVHVTWGQTERGVLHWQNIWGSQFADLKIGDGLSLVVELASRSIDQRLLLAFPHRPGQWAPQDQCMSCPCIQ